MPVTEKEYIELLKHHRIQDALLREFLMKGLWKPAIQSCELGIERRKAEIHVLESVRESLRDMAKN